MKINKNKMRILILLICFTLPILASAQKKQSFLLPEDQQENILEVVNTWMSEMFKAEGVDKLMPISDIPFAWDYKKVLLSREELKEAYMAVFEDKGSRPVPQYEIMLSEHKVEIVDGVVPLSYVVAEVAIGQGDDKVGIIICISKKEDDYKIVGFSD